jgi:hypothetical protein
VDDGVDDGMDDGMDGDVDGDIAVASQARHVVMAGA